MVGLSELEAKSYLVLPSPGYRGSNLLQPPCLELYPYITINMGILQGGTGLGREGSQANKKRDTSSWVFTQAPSTGTSNPQSRQLYYVTNSGWQA